MQDNGFQIAFCETNLRWLAGEPPSDERTRKQQKMVEEIARLKDSVAPNSELDRSHLHTVHAADCAVALNGRHACSCKTNAEAETSARSDDSSPAHCYVAGDRVQMTDAHKERGKTGTVRYWKDGLGAVVLDDGRVFFPTAQQVEPHNKTLCP